MAHQPVDAQHSVEWINAIVEQLWPYINGAAQDWLENTLLPEIGDKLGSSVSLTIDKFDFGQESFRLEGVTVYPKRDASRLIVVDTDINYDGDLHISALISGVSVGVQNVKLTGRLRLLLGPLLKKPPLLGAITGFFLRSPTFSYELTGVATQLDALGLQPLIDGAVESIINQTAVLPNRFVYVLASESVDASIVQYPDPQALLEIKLLGLSNVDSKDIGRHKKSDVVVKVEVAGLVFQTSAYEDVKNVTLNTTFKAILNEHEDTIMTISVLDEDKVSGSNAVYEKIGSTEINLSRVKPQDSLTVTLDESKSTELSLELSRFDLHSLVPQTVSTTESYLVVARLGRIEGIQLSGSTTFSGRLALGDKEWQLKVANEVKGDTASPLTLSGSGVFTMAVDSPSVDYAVQISEQNASDPAQEVGLSEGMVEFKVTPGSRIDTVDLTVKLSDTVTAAFSVSLKVLVAATSSAE
eukprot:scpid48497/ scgid18065/ Extended synaptotagmin-3; Chr3Syt